MTATALAEQVEDHYACKLPFLRTCDGPPRMSGLGDGLCWYHAADTCPSGSLRPTCDDVPSAEIEDGLRFCPCINARPGRRLLSGSGEPGGMQDELRPDPVLYRSVANVEREGDAHQPAAPPLNIDDRQGRRPRCPMMVAASRNTASPHSTGCSKLTSHEPRADSSIPAALAMQAWPENVLPPLLFGALSLLLVGTLLVSIAHYPARRDRRIKLMVVTAGSLMAAPAESHNVLHSGHRTPET